MLRCEASVKSLRAAQNRAGGALCAKTRDRAHVALAAGLAGLYKAPMITIDIVMDPVCPWCWIGERRLARALAQSGQAATLRRRPFMLNPNMPPEGEDRRAHHLAKFGGEEAMRRIYAQMTAAAQAEGLQPDLDRIARQPNTLDAHRLLRWGETAQDDLAERIFRAFFTEGRDIGDRAVLAAIAGEAGLDAAAARAFLDSGEGADAIRAEAASASDAGVTGVPFFIINDQFAAPGAVSAEQWAQIFAQLNR